MPDELLKRFREEVLSGGAIACLPCNLSDSWLDVLAERAEADEINELMAAVVTLLLAKSGSEDGALTIGHDELVGRLQEYHMEIGLEQVSRASEFRAEPATLETIFTDRNVRVTDTGG